MFNQYYILVLGTHTETQTHIAETKHAPGIKIFIFVTGLAKTNQVGTQKFDHVFQVFCIITFCLATPSKYNLHPYCIIL